MCGIAGVFRGQSGAPATGEELGRMVAMLAHRGPDGHGFYLDDLVGLGHARLSLIDLAGGFQPIRNGDGTMWLVFNGEIFNYLEIRRMLSSLGHRFYTDGDSEVIVQCYERFGPQAWQMFNGQFAFALWDSRRRLMWLVRDRLGILPLYYAIDGHRLVFASEAKAIFAGRRVAAAIDGEALADLFTTWSVNPSGSVFRTIRQVPPATALKVDERMAIAAQCYWRPDPPPVSGQLSAEAVADGLESHLEQSISLRLRADVPVGAYVSGGLDSSVIACLAARRAGAPLETFGIRFADRRFDETEEQRRVVNFLGTRHHELLCDDADIRHALAEVVWHCETPLLRTSPVPLFLLSRKVRDSGIKTVLTGEGADELLAGYTIFKEDAIRRFWARQPHSRIRPALLSRIHHYVGNAADRSGALWQRFFAGDLRETAHPFYAHLIRWRNTAWTQRLLAPDIRRAHDPQRMMERMASAMPQDWLDWPPLQRAQWTEIHTFMSPYLLSCQGDRVAMAHGVEARYPFLDPRFVDYCLSLPDHHKMRGLRDKLALRRLAARHLPPAVWNRRKQPYRAPIAAALGGADSPEVADLLSQGSLATDDLLDGKAVSLLLTNARRRCWRDLSEREEMGLAGVYTLLLLRQSFGADFDRRAEAAHLALAARPAQILIDRRSAASAPISISLT